MKALLCLSLILATSAVSAKSVEERRYWKEQMRPIDDSIKEGEEDCG